MASLRRKAEWMLRLLRHRRDYSRAGGTEVSQWGCFGCIRVDRITTERQRDAAAIARGTRTLRETLKRHVEERVLFPAVEIEVPPLVFDHLVAFAFHRGPQ